MTYRGGRSIPCDANGTPISVTGTSLNVNVTGSVGDVFATGSLTNLNDALTVSINDKANVAFQISYTTFTGQISFEGTSGAEWVPIFGYLAGTGQTKTQYTNPATGTIYRCTVAGFTQVRCRLSNANTGTTTIYAVVSEHTSGVFLNFPIPSGANIIGQVGIDQTTPGTTNKVSVTNLDVALSTIPGLSIPIHDYIAQSQSATQDVWTFYTGGSGGTLVATITINYVNSTKAVITNVAKT